MKILKKFYYYFISFIFIMLLAQSVSADYKASEVGTTVTKKLRLADRFYVQSVLSEIFGPDSTAVTEKFIFRQPNSFGGPCDVYEQVRIGKNADSLADPHSYCPGGNLSVNVPMTGVSNMLRQGYILHTCKLLTTEPKTLDFALKQIFPDEKVQMPNRKNLQTVFQLFHPESDPSAKLLDSLKKIGTKNRNTKKRWSEILYTECIDPTWQII